MEEWRSLNPTSSPVWFWEGRRGFLTVRKTQPNSKQIILQVSQEGREAGTSRRRQAQFLSGGCGPFLSAEEAPGTPSPQGARPPSQPALPAGRSALTTAPRCLPRGRGRLHLPVPTSTRGRSHETRGPACPPARPPRGPTSRHPAALTIAPESRPAFLLPARLVS